MPEWKILWRETIRQINTHSHHCSASLTLHLGAAVAIVISALLTHHMSSCCGTAANRIQYLEPACCWCFLQKYIHTDLWFRSLVVPTNCSSLLTTQMPDEAPTYAIFCFRHKEWTEINAVHFPFVLFLCKVMFVLMWDQFLLIWQLSLRKNWKWLVGRLVYSNVASEPVLVAGVV